MTLSNTDNVPRIILGSMTFGLEGTDGTDSLVRIRGPENVERFLKAFHAHGHIEIDTARIYNHGDSEAVMGQLPMAHFKISTKVWPDFPGAHDADQLPKQFRHSLAALQATKVDILYLHAPDFDTPFEVTAKAVDALYREGLFERFGLSNFAAWQVAHIYEICKQNGYVLPTVYQGMYNPIARAVVPELLPCLKYYNIGFYGYNPVGAGLLTGKYKFSEDTQEGTRYDPNVSSRFRRRYWKSLNFEGVQILEKAAKENDVTLLEATLRWMRHHSSLGSIDGIIIGASSIEQLEQNLTELEKGPLPDAMVRAFDEAWEHVKPAAEHYYRGPEVPRASFGLKRE
ncbi:hypothetical protein BGZ58_003348 [Dissophora ornata]|nr:hypothetical protein BGZ58_003348 [Dissophora ornata]